MPSEVPPKPFELRSDDFELLDYESERETPEMLASAVDTKVPVHLSESCPSFLMNLSRGSSRSSPAWTEIPAALASEVVAAMHAIVVRLAAARGPEPDIVLRDASGHLILLLELKVASGGAEEVAWETIGEGTSAVLTGSLAGTLARLMAEWSRQNVAFRDVLEALAPKDRGSLSAAALLQARRNAEARRELLSEFPALTSAEVATPAGSRAANRASLANRWRDEGKVFAIRVGEQQLYPGFQFDEHGRSIGTVASVLSAFDGKLADWQTALWFTAPTGWLGGRRPVDAMGDGPEPLSRPRRATWESLSPAVGVSPPPDHAKLNPLITVWPSGKKSCAAIRAGTERPSLPSASARLRADGRLSCSSCVSTKVIVPAR